MKPKPTSIPLPKNWSQHATFALVCASALGRAVVTEVRGWAINSPVERVRLRAECERLTALVAQQQEELAWWWASRCSGRLRAQRKSVTSLM